MTVEGSRTLPVFGGIATVYDTPLCPNKGLNGPIQKAPISASGVTVGEAAREFGAASFIDYIHSGSDIDPYGIPASLGIGFAPHIRSRYISFPMKNGGYAVTFNVPHIETGMEGHMVGVALWAQLLKRLREERPEMLAYTFYEGDSGWRSTIDPFLNVMATSFTTSLVGGFSEIGDEKEAQIVDEVHKGEVLDGLPAETVQHIRRFIKDGVKRGLEEGRSALHILFATHNRLSYEGYMDRRNPR